MSGIAAAAPLGSLDTLRRALADFLLGEHMLATAAAPYGTGPTPGGTDYPPETRSDADAARLAALVDLARDGDSESFGALYDHYAPSVYRFVYYRVGGQQLAEDLVGETFFRALRSMSSFQWQGKDFGAWLMTIARNLIVDHFKSARSRLETSTDDFTTHAGTTSGPEDEVLAGLTNAIVHEALTKLPTEQQECLVLRFLNSYSIAETAKVLHRSEGAIKQLQLRAIRNLAKQLPEGIR
ncbi:MAG: sigma-70 family RNA polymerase sigma factor [Nocardioidaceae bacterium]